MPEIVKKAGRKEGKGTPKKYIMYQEGTSGYKALEILRAHNIDVAKSIEKDLVAFSKTVEKSA